jgi:hypothetical protein
MNNIIIMAPFAQITINAPSEGERFWKSPGAHGYIFYLIQRVKEIPDVFDFEEVVGIVEIKAGELMKSYPVRQNRIRRSGKDVYFVSEVPQGPAEIVYINSLTAAGGIPPIGQ